MKSPVPRQRPKILALIALFKMAKAIACVVLAATAFHLIDADVAAHLGAWLESLTWVTRHGVVARVVAWFVELGPRQFRVFGILAVVYAALYAVQGIGLWCGKRWAEYLIVIETGLLLPLEVWELVHKFTPFKLSVLLINAAIVAYLIHVLRKPSADTRRY